MKSIAEILKSKGITEETRFHSYEYLYKMIKTCCDEYGRQFCIADVMAMLPSVREIEIKSAEYATDIDTKEFYKDCCHDFRNGALWMLEEIKKRGNVA